jgi:hypothetical protein
LHVVLPPVNLFKLRDIGDIFMKTRITTLCLIAGLAFIASAALAKLPTPSDEAKAKAAEAAAKTAWAGKVDAYQLCLSQDKVAAHYKKLPEPKAAKAPVKGASAAPASAGACTDPGPFVYPPAVPNMAVAPAVSAPAAPDSVATPKKP